MSKPDSSWRIGATWGAVAGLVLALLLVRRHPHLHLHGGEVGLIFVVCVGVCAVLGAGFARRRSRNAGDKAAFTPDAASSGSRPAPPQVP